jgi:hypothetical protein
VEEVGLISPNHFENQTGREILSLPSAKADKHVERRKNHMSSYLMTRGRKFSTNSK